MIKINNQNVDSMMMISLLVIKTRNDSTSFFQTQGWTQKDVILTFQWVGNKSVQNHTWIQAVKEKNTSTNIQHHQMHFTGLVLNQENIIKVKFANITTMIGAGVLFMTLAGVMYYYVHVCTVWAVSSSEAILSSFNFCILVVENQMKSSLHTKSPTATLHHFQKSKIHVNYCPVSNYKQYSVCTFKIMLWQNYHT